MIDVAWVVLLEIYKDYGMKYEEATAQLKQAIDEAVTTEAAPAKEPEPDNQASLAMLQAMMGGSDFGGPRG